MIRWLKQRRQRKVDQALAAQAEHKERLLNRDATRDLLRELKASNASMVKAKPRPSLDAPLFSVVEHSDRKITVTFTTSKASRHDTMTEVGRRLDAIYEPSLVGRDDNGNEWSVSAFGNPTPPSTQVRY